MPQPGYSFPAEQESKPNPWINTSFALTRSPKSEPRNWYRVKKRFQLFWWIESKLWIQTAPEGYHFYSLDLKSESWIALCFQPRFILTSCFSIQQNKQGQPYLQAAHFGVEPLQLHSQPLPLLSKILPCTPKLKSGPDLPPSRGPWGTLITMRGTSAGVPWEASGALLSPQASRSLVLFVPQQPLIVGCSGSRLPHDSLADVLSLNK